MMKHARLLLLAFTVALAGQWPAVALANPPGRKKSQARVAATAPHEETKAGPARAATAAAPPFVVVPAVDISKSAGIYAPLVRAELVRVIQAIPNGIPFSVIAFGQDVRPVYRGVGGSDAVAQAEAALGRLAFTGEGSDIGAGLLAAAAEAAALDERAPALVIAVTDGEPRPVHSSPFAGKGLDVLLGLPAIVGDPGRRHLAVRIYGTVRPSPSASNVTVMPSEPNWPDVLARFADSVRPSSPSSAALPVSGTKNPPSRIPTILAAITLLAFLAVGGWWALSWLTRTRAERQEAAMLQQVVEEEAEEEPTATRRFTVAQCDGDERATLDADQPSVTIGSKFDDDLVINAAGSGACISLEVRSRDDVELYIENTGMTPISVGTLVVSRGKRQRLPTAAYLEVSVGGEVFAVEEVAAEQEEVVQ